nr:MAG TPA: hypothetical protein [Caudoviricetes sp.]
MVMKRFFKVTNLVMSDSRKPLFFCFVKLID